MSEMKNAGHARTFTPLRRLPRMTVMQPLAASHPRLMLCCLHVKRPLVRGVGRTTCFVCAALRLLIFAFPRVRCSHVFRNQKLAKQKPWQNETKLGCKDAKAMEAHFGHEVNRRTPPRDRVGLVGHAQVKDCKLIPATRASEAIRLLVNHSVLRTEFLRLAVVMYALACSTLLLPQVLGRTTTVPGERTAVLGYRTPLR